MTTDTSLEPRPSEAFADFAAGARGRSTVYEQLSAAAAEDAWMCSLLAQAPPEQRRANLLFAAVHDLVLEQGPSSPLAPWYPSVGGTRAPDTELTATFRQVVADHEDRVVAALRTKATQTNEVGRVAALWPAVQWLVQSWEGPVALVELGTSGGLLLHMDRLGHAATDRPVDIAHRVGVDLSPRDVTDPADARWLRACLWPDQLDRLRRLDEAIAVAVEHGDFEVVAGDVAAVLPNVLDRVPADVLPVVFHSAAVTYLPDEARRRLYAQLEQAGDRRPLVWLSFEGTRIEPLDHLLDGVERPERSFVVAGATWSAGQRTDHLLGFADGHGQWTRWVAPVATS